MRLLLPFSLLAISIVGRSAAVAQSLPSDVQKVLDVADSQIDQLTRDANETAQSRQEKLLTDLRKLQGDLTKKALLDEAVSIRDLLRTVADVVGVESRRKILQGDTASLPPDGLTLVSTYLEKTSQDAEEFAESLERLETEKREQLQPLFEKYTKAGNLDASIAIRNAMKGAEPVIAGGGRPKSASITLAADPALARKQYQERTQKLTAEQQASYARLIERLIPRLQAALAKETRAANLDGAVKIRDLIKAVNEAQNPSARLQLIRNSREGFSSTVAEAVSELLKDADAVDSAILAERTQLDAALAPVIEAEVGKILLDGDSNKSRLALNEYFQLRRESEKIFALNSSRTSPLLSSRAAEQIDKFTSQAEVLSEQAGQDETQRRAVMIEALQQHLKNPGTTADQQEAINNVLDFTQADYSEGLYGMLLFRTPKNLPDAAAEALKEYRTALKEIRVKLKEAHQESWNKLNDEMKPVIREHIAAGEFLEGFQARERLPELRSIECSIPVRVARHAYSDHLWDAHITDVRGENTFLVKYHVGDAGEWMPRSRIKFGPDDQIVVADMAKRQQPEGPGSQVTVSTKLRRGQKAFKFWGSTWYTVTIQDVTPQGVSISWDGWGDRTENCERSDLRLMEDE